MNYRTKIPIATLTRIIPAGSNLIKSEQYNGEYYYEFECGDNFYLKTELVETHPEIYEPVLTKEWTDKDMLDFAEWCYCKPSSEHRKILHNFKIVRDK